VTLRTQMTTDATTVFMVDGDFKESVSITYHPHRYYGATLRADRTIDAVIERQRISVLSGDGDTVAPIWILHVANDSTLGISSDELDLGGDAVTISPRDGDTAERRSITELLSQDHAMLELEVR